ncbi:hypothetical protein GLE_1564 [Lysobacter enzymogenes]|uniref:Uncharacterized protein n=1 Tax=Lysobacter enzymogenes TaxID=69 RepID=A0A0S2DED4_LYSEN|nr:hypothetical protein GLE_1564 [Lysobacter enzymogenes]
MGHRSVRSRVVLQVVGGGAARSLKRAPRPRARPEPARRARGRRGRCAPSQRRAGCVAARKLTNLVACVCIENATSLRSPGACAVSGAWVRSVSGCGRSLRNARARKSAAAAAARNVGRRGAAGCAGTGDAGVRVRIRRSKHRTQKGGDKKSRPGATPRGRHRLAAEGDQPQQSRVDERRGRARSGRGSKARWSAKPRQRPRDREGTEGSPARAAKASRRPDANIGAARDGRQGRAAMRIEQSGGDDMAATVAARADRELDAAHSAERRRAPGYGGRSARLQQDYIEAYAVADFRRTRGFAVAARAAATGTAPWPVRP